MAVLPVPAARPFIVEEDSKVLKAITCVPLIGIPVYLDAMENLHRKIQLTREPRELVELGRVCNEFHVFNIVRNVLHCALLITGIALSIFGTFLTVVVALSLGLHLYSIRTNISAIITNSQITTELVMRGFRPGMMMG